jgi:RNA polymerase sigma-70 factor (ECF subfamily)
MKATDQWADSVTAATATMTGAVDLAPDRDDIVARARGGDVGAFEELYRRHAGRVYALCLRMTRNTADAEDMTQEVFVRTWQKLGSFRGDSAFSTWLHRLTINFVLTERRGHQRRADRVTTTDDLTACEKPELPRRTTHSMDIEQAVAGLPEGARRVFVLHDVEGYKHHEIAEMMGIATGTTKAQLHRARRLLREALA